MAEMRPFMFDHWTSAWFLDDVGWKRNYVTPDGTERQQYGPSRRAMSDADDSMAPKRALGPE